MNASAASVESWLGAQSFGEQRVGLLVRGEIVDEWRVEAYLGRGLSAEVYRVTNVRFGHDGALKLLVDGSRGLAARCRAQGRCSFANGRHLGPTIRNATSHVMYAL